MQSPYKKVIVYDLETGGLDVKKNSVTEIAMVVVDLETLTIEEKYSSIIKPYYDFSDRVLDAKREARSIFKSTSEKDQETKETFILHKGQKVNAKQLDVVLEDIDSFGLLLDRKGLEFNNEQFEAILNSGTYTEGAKLYFNKTYNPQAMKVTHMTKQMLQSEGKDVDVVVEEVLKLIEKYTQGNNKPILAGHNIKKFDNAFLEKLLLRGTYKLEDLINETQMIDTLEWARLRWFDSSSYSLGVCCNQVGLTLKEAHRALPDTEANAQLLIKMLKGLRGHGSNESKYERRKFNFNF